MSTPRDPADHHPDPQRPTTAGDTTTVPAADRTDSRHIAPDRDADGVDDRREAAAPVVVDRDGDGVDDRREATAPVVVDRDGDGVDDRRRWRPTPPPTDARSPPASARRSAA